MTSFKPTGLPLGLVILVGIAAGLLLALASRWIGGVLMAVFAIPALLAMAWIARYLLRQGAAR